MALTHDEAMALITPFYNLFRHDKRDWDKGFAALADDWKSWDGNDTYRGKAETRGFLEGLFSSVPDINVTNLQLVVEGDPRLTFDTQGFSLARDDEENRNFRILLGFLSLFVLCPSSF